MTGHYATDQYDSDPDDSYDRFVVGCLKDCRCCDDCGTDRPCAGVLAGGLCDEMCHCRDEADDDEGATDADE